MLLRNAFLIISSLVPVSVGSKDHAMTNQQQEARQSAGPL